jgi:hypothetical protein
VSLSRKLNRLTTIQATGGGTYEVAGCIEHTIQIMHEITAKRVELAANYGRIDRFPQNLLERRVRAIDFISLDLPRVAVDDMYLKSGY